MLSAKSKNDSNLFDRPAKAIFILEAVTARRRDSSACPDGCEKAFKKDFKQLLLKD
jgi:hypothetical protein